MNTTTARFFFAPPHNRSIRPLRVLWSCSLLVVRVKCASSLRRVQAADDLCANVTRVGTSDEGARRGALRASARRGARGHTDRRRDAATTMRALSCLLLVLLALLLARDAAAAPRRGLRATQEVAVAVDPVGIVRSTTLSASAVVYSSPSRRRADALPLSRRRLERDPQLLLRVRPPAPLRRRRPAPFAVLRPRPGEPRARFASSVALRRRRDARRKTSAECALECCDILMNDTKRNEKNERRRGDASLFAAMRIPVSRLARLSPLTGTPCRASRTVSRRARARARRTTRARRRRARPGPGSSSRRRRGGHRAAWTPS